MFRRAGKNPNLTLHTVFKFAVFGERSICVRGLWARSRMRCPEFLIVDHTTKRLPGLKAAHVPLPSQAKAYSKRRHVLEDLYQSKPDIAFLEGSYLGLIIGQGNKS
jgi:hypothetical protein